MTHPTYFNPEWYRGEWRIYVSGISSPPYIYCWQHDDYDLEDTRAGYSTSIDEAKRAIDDWYHMFEEKLPDYGMEMPEDLKQ